jgi:predicted dehydrogenase
VNGFNRRSFLRTASAVSAGSLLAPRLHALGAAQDEPARTISANDNIQIALIGAGGQGQYDTRTAVQVPGVKLVAVADCYNGRLERAKEIWGPDTFTTRDYNEILARKDIDAMIVGTPDHWHMKASVDAMKAGKDVYCEKPMSHNVADGLAMVEAVQAGKRIFQAGSQRVSSILYKKAAEIYASGRLGEVHSIDAHLNRNSPGGAWIYPIAPDASPETIDWNGFLVDAPQLPFDPKRFFRWRMFADYGSGLGGDLFVHLISGIQAITGMNTTASRAYSSGGLYHFKDGRDFPDFLETVYDYPGMQVHVHCNQNNNDGGDTISIFGSRGTLVVYGSSLTFTPQDTTPRFEAYGWHGMTEAQKKQGQEEWNAAYTAIPPELDEVESFTLPQGYDDTADHIANFFRAVETREHVVEDEVFGNNAAIGCHLANYSYFHRTVATWDAATKTIKG